MKIVKRYKLLAHFFLHGELIRYTGFDAVKLYITTFMLRKN